MSTLPKARVILIMDVSFVNDAMQVNLTTAGRSASHWNGSRN